MLLRKVVWGFSVCAALAAATPAQAQIYSWTDADGRLVVSNTQRPPEGIATKTYSVPAASSVRATRPAADMAGRGRFDALIEEHARLQGIRTDLVRAVVQVESGFNPRALSPKGAMGLMQLMPDTARQLGVVNPYNPEENIRGGVQYLRQLLDRYGSEQLALAAYNAGPGAVDRYGVAVPPYRETRNYVAKIGQISGTSTRARRTKIYTVLQVVDGREVVKYTDKKPQ
jgi:soluble lytic murein transglycosylase-like protein